MDFKKESGIIGMLKKYNSGRGVKAASSEEKLYVERLVQQLL